MPYVYDKDGNPYYVTNNTNNIFNNEGERLDDILKDLKSSIRAKEIVYIRDGNWPSVGDVKVLYCDGKDFYRWNIDTAQFDVIRSDLLNNITSSSHSHTNKVTLDSITAAFTTALQQQLSQAYSHSNTDHAPTNAQKNVQSDWSAIDGDSYILNKPTLGTASACNKEDFASKEQGQKADTAIQKVYFGETECEKTESDVHIPGYTGAVSTVLYDDLKNNYVVTTNDSGKIVTDKIPSAKLDYLINVSADIQEQFDAIGRNLTTETERATAAEAAINNTINQNTSNWSDKYTRNEIDNKFSTLEMATDWKESVETFSDIAVTYPEPEDGWTVNVKDTNITYRYSSTEWIAISANAIPLATETLDGLLKATDKRNYDDTNQKKHIHENKDSLDIITDSFIEKWNNTPSLAEFEFLQEEFNRIKKIYNFTLLASDWSTTAPYTQTVQAEWLKTEDTPILLLDIPISAINVDEKKIISEWEFISDAESLDGGLTIICNKQKPTVDLTILVKL